MAPVACLTGDRCTTTLDAGCHQPCQPGCVLVGNAERSKPSAIHRAADKCHAVDGVVRNIEHQCHDARHAEVMPFGEPVQAVTHVGRKTYLLRTPQQMTATLIGYVRCSTDKQDLTAQRQALAELGVAPDRIYTDKGLTGTNRARPGSGHGSSALG